MTDWVVAKRGGEAKDRVGRNDRLSPVGERKRVSRQEKDGKKRQEAAKRMGKGGGIGKMKQEEVAEKMGKVGHFESPLAGPLPPSRMGPAYAPFCPFWPLLPLGFGPF